MRGGARGCGGGLCEMGRAAVAVLCAGWGEHAHGVLAALCSGPCGSPLTTPCYKHRAMGRALTRILAGVTALVLLAGALFMLMRTPAAQPAQSFFIITLYPLPTLTTTTALPTSTPGIATPTGAATTLTPPPAAIDIEIAVPTATPTLALIPLVAIAVAPSAPTLEPAVEATAAVAIQVASSVTPIPIAPSSGCPTQSSAQFGLINIDGIYKNNRLTDYNPDLRLSVLSYGPAEPQTALTLVDYNGDTDGNAPRLQGLFEPNRVPGISAVYRRNNWRWDENGPAPYGARNGINDDWPASVVDLGTTPGEGIYPPERNAEIGGGFVAMVLFASETELSLAYHRQDGVTDGYVAHVLGMCVDPNLLALYRAQTIGGLRSSGLLPGVRNNQRIGTASGSALTVAIRDRGIFLDPRSRKDWWQ
jgi:hypothetical protein